MPVEKGAPLHLGIDLFQVEGAPIRAPLDGEVVGCADCNGHRDYGGVVMFAPPGGSRSVLYAIRSPGPEIRV